MNEWWSGLTALNKGMYCGASFFSVLFLWQLVAALLGLGGDDWDDADVAADDLHGGDSVDTMSAFQWLSIRSIITFLTLFTWGSALYLNDGRSVGSALAISTVWGFAGMATVAFLLYLLPRLAHTGTKNIRTAIGGPGVVYLDIPEGGTGEVRTDVSGVTTHVKARAADGRALKAGVPVVVVRAVGENLVEVKAADRT